MSAKIKITIEHSVEGVSEYNVRADIVKMSEYFQSSLINNTINITSEASIRGSTFKHILAYCLYHLENSEIDHLPCEEDKNVSFTWDLPTTFRILRAAEFLNITNLLEVALLRAKEIINSSKVTELKELLSFPDHLSAEDRVP